MDPLYTCLYMFDSIKEQSGDREVEDIAKNEFAIIDLVKAKKILDMEIERDKMKGTTICLETIFISVM